MAIKAFLITLFVSSALFLLYDIEAIKDNIQQEEKPLVSFYDSISYSLDQESVKSIVRSSEAYMYKKREEMVNATMLSRDDKRTVANFLKSDFATKVGDDFYFEGNVFFQSKEGLELTTEQLEYNSNNKIVKNYLAFEIDHDGNRYKGERLFYDSQNSVLKAYDIKFLLKGSND